MNIRTVVVDDEALARARLRRFLAQEPDIEIVGECANGPEALDCIRQLQPHLVFLDLRMPEMDGLQLVRALPAHALPAIVFVTAHDQYAVGAFEVRATDYLLKPVTRARLQEAVRRVRQHLKNAQPAVVPAPSSVPPAQAGVYLNRFAIKDGNQTVFVRIVEVDYIEAAANYVVLCTAKGNHILRETLRNLEVSLPPEIFLRISRSVIVNMDRIKAIRSAGAGEWQVVLDGEKEFLMTRGIKEVQERLQYSSSRPLSATL